MEDRERRDMLEGVINTFALNMLKHSSLRAKPEHFKIFLSHDMLPTAVMKWGDPVQIFIQELDVVKAFTLKGIYLSELRTLIDSCLRTVPRLHPSTAIVIPAKVIKREEERWVAHTKEEVELFPCLIDEARINYNIQLYVTATDIQSKRVVRFVTKNLDVMKVRRDVREALSTPLQNDPLTLDTKDEQS